MSLPPGIGAQQSLALSLFERSLEQLRQESGIPGLSAVIVQNRRVVWERGFGMADLERAVHATPNTPYPVGDLTQTFAATLVLQRVERGDIELTDRMQRWTTLIPEPSATVEQVLRHTSTGTFGYEPQRFAEFTPILEYYTKVPFKKILAAEVLERLAMHDSVPGHDMEAPSPLEVPFFDQSVLDRYAAVVQQLAVPYRVDMRRRATRSEYPHRSITAGTGLISSARDLARFDAAIDDDILVDRLTTEASRQPAGGRTGLGWFVQQYNNDLLVWHFGNSPNAFSSLMLKVPTRDLTLILIANSDGLSAPFDLERGDVTASLFARLFLRAFVL
ncbi:MAG: serine hydrolase domain-containing protein [Vicinamibacterales bacterium]